MFSLIQFFNEELFQYALHGMQVLQQTVVALRLRHPNIVTVMGTSVDPPTRALLLVTALLERGTLYDLLHNDTVSLPGLALSATLAATWSAALHAASLETKESSMALIIAALQSPPLPGPPCNALPCSDLPCPAPPCPALLCPQDLYVILVPC